MRLRSLRRSRIPHQAGLAPSGNSIAARLRWSYLISSTLPLLIVGVLLINMNTTAQQLSVYTDQKEQSGAIARNIGRYVTSVYQQLQEFSLQVRTDASAEQLQAEALDLQGRNRPNLVSVAVISPQGREQARVYNQQAVPEASLRFLGGSRSVQNALAGQANFSTIAVNQDALRTFIVTLPARDDAGNVVGAVQAEVRADPIVEELSASTIDQGSYAYLVQLNRGTMLAADGTPRFLPSPELTRLLDTGSGAAEYIGVRGQPVIGAVAPTNLDDQTPIGWSVVVEQPSAIAFAYVRRSVLVLVLLLMLVGGLALLWAFRQARTFLEPLDELRSGAIAIGDGHLDRRIQVDLEDELGQVARAFNYMAGHLQQSLDQIERQNERLRQGLALARDIQIGLLPDRAPWGGEDIAVYARSIPAYEVGGDFYTYLALSEGRAAIAIGDISGKGVGAALLMSLTSSAVESQGRQLEHPGVVLGALNQLLAPRLKANHMNAALQFAVFDPRERRLRIANAGMISPILITGAGCQFIDVGGLPIGAFAGATYQEVTLAIEPGDALLLVSDGVVEAHNAQGELFGFDRLEAAVAEAQGRADVRALVELVLAQVQEFMGEAEQHDDITLVAVRPELGLESIALDEKEHAGHYATV